MTAALLFGGNSRQARIISYQCYPKEPAAAPPGEARAGVSPEAFTPGQVDTALAGAAKGARGWGA